MADILERGDVFFLYRPAVEVEDPAGLVDVQRIYMVLRPDDAPDRQGAGDTDSGAGEPHRLIQIGRKKLPDPDERGTPHWAFVERVADSADRIAEVLGPEEYRTKTRGVRHQPGARPAGEGRYALVAHRDHVHLAYALELPEEPGEVQRALNLEEQGGWVVTVKNPHAKSPAGAGLDSERRADYPERLLDAFGERRFIPAEPIELLDYEGAELLLIAADHQPEAELGIDLPAADERPDSADVFDEIRLRPDDREARPLFEGEWQ